METSVICSRMAGGGKEAVIPVQTPRQFLFNVDRPLTRTHSIRRAKATFYLTSTGRSIKP